VHSEVLALSVRVADARGREGGQAAPGDGDVGVVNVGGDDVLEACGQLDSDLAGAAPDVVRKLKGGGVCGVVGVYGSVYEGVECGRVVRAREDIGVPEDEIVGGDSPEFLRVLFGSAARYSSCDGTAMRCRASGREDGRLRRCCTEQANLGVEKGDEASKSPSKDEGSRAGTENEPS